MPKKLDGAEGDVANAPILVKAYGEFWNPDFVSWNNGGTLLGQDRAGRTINVYEQRGVYVLYEDYAPVYVGRGDKQSIGWRLLSHRESRRKGPRWDRFSWFGINKIRKNGKLSEANSFVHPRTSELIATLEALLIMAINPRLNARREKFKNALQLFQSDKDRPVSTEKRLASIEGKLDSLLDLRVAK
jgi:hypothetical protein